MSKYTFVVEFEDGKEPACGAGTEILGGKLCIVAFTDLHAEMLAQPVSRGDNWKLVPVEPTAEMINAALASGAISIRTAYSAMLAAAPEGGNDHDTRR